MERTERLLDLVALLLDAKRPLTWEEIYDAFPTDYGGSLEAAERKFERDKTELLELGIPPGLPPAGRRLRAWLCHRPRTVLLARTGAQT